MVRRALIVIVLTTFGLWQFGSGVWIHVKALLAQQLLLNAWANTRDGETRAHPWPWADTWPIVRLTVPAHGIDLIVLSGASGRNLAFGPAHLDGSAHPGHSGNSIIAGHRDTHFSFLRNLRPGDEIFIESPDGLISSFLVGQVKIADVRKSRLVLSHERPAITLVTCYPFDAVTPGGPLRYVVSAELAGEGKT